MTTKAKVTLLIAAVLEAGALLAQSAPDESAATAASPGQPAGVWATTQWVQAPSEIAPIQSPFAMPQLQRPLFPDRTFNLTDYGAKGDGTAKNTEAFGKAIAACHGAGGGRVVVPAGKWLTGAIHLQSNVNLHLQEGAEIHFSDDPSDYCPWCSLAGPALS